MSTKKLLLFVFLSFIGVSLKAATYYTSTTGNDTTGNGTISNPWQTIQKGQSMLSPGDTLFIRGGIYRESVTITSQGSASNPVTIKAYQDETPILDGRSVISGWTRCAVNEPGLTVAGETNVNATSIYKATINTSGLTTSELWRMLYEDGAHSFLCRWPEQSQGYGLEPEEFQDVPTEAVGSTNGLMDNIVLNPATTGGIWYPYIKNLTASQLASYWNGSYLQIWFRSGGNTTASYSISGYASNKITTGTLKRGLLTDDKYCLYRHPHLVNEPGKFYFSPAVGDYQVCYFWPRNTANLTNKITLATKAKGIYASNKDYVVIDGLKVVGFEDVGIHFINSTSTNPIIKNCVVEDCGSSGIYIQNTTDAVVDTCTVNRVGDRGIFINGGSNCVIKNSTTRDNRGTCISMYTVENGQIINNTIYDARGVHVNGVSCYLGCEKILIAKNRFDPGVNLALQNISDVCIFANIMDGGGEKANLLSTWVDTTNSNHATDGYQVYLNNTFINSPSPYTMINFHTGNGTFEGATISNNNGKVRLNDIGEFTSTQFKYTGTYGLMIYCDFSGTYTDGWYESIANTADTCTIDLAYVSSSPTVDGKCGGRSENYLYNNLIGGCSEWESNMYGRSYNWWMPKTYGGTFSTPNPPLEGEIYTYYTSRTTALNSCFTDWVNQNYTLKADSPAIGAGMTLTAINTLLNDTTIGANGTSIRQNFPDFDFTTDRVGNAWAATPSMGAYEYASGDPTPTSYSLNITTANGIVNKKVDGITTTATSFPVGTIVELTASANTGYSFANWSGDATGTTNPVSITMNTNEAVTANFSQIPADTYTLNLSKTGNGSIQVNGTNRSLPWSGTFSAGASVTVVAIPDNSWQFSEWSGDLAGDTTLSSLTIDNNKSVTANFVSIDNPPSDIDNLPSDPVISQLFEQTFDATNTYQTISTAGWNLSANTITLWANPGNLSGSHYILGHATAGWKNRIQIYLRDSKLMLGLGDNHTVETDLATFQTGQWYFISLSWNGTEYIVQVDGQTRGNGTYAGLTAFETFADIGNTGVVTDRTIPFVGIIGDVRIYNRVLSDTETSAIYTYGRANTITPVAHWLFDDQSESTFSAMIAKDSSGNNLDGSLMNDPLWGDAWAEDYCLRFDGGNQAVEVSCESLRAETGTVALWVEPATAASYQILFGHTDGSGNVILLYTDAGRLGVVLNGVDQLTTETLGSGVMYYVTLTWNETEYVVYLDGEQKAMGIFSGLTALAATADIANVGTAAGRSSNFGFDGIVDDVQLYSRALSADEIRALYYTVTVKENRALAFLIEGGPYTHDDFDNLPTGAEFDEGTQELIWKPWYDQAGDHTVLLSAPDQQSVTLTLSVQDVKVSDWYREFLRQNGEL